MYQVQRIEIESHKSNLETQKVVKDGWSWQIAILQKFVMENWGTCTY